jgi:hypothetical protein
MTRTRTCTRQYPRPLNRILPVIWQWFATLYCTSSFLVFLFFLSCEYEFSPSCILHSFATALCHHIIASSKIENISPLAALVPLRNISSSQATSLIPGSCMLAVRMGVGGQAHGA